MIDTDLRQRMVWLRDLLRRTRLLAPKALHNLILACAIHLDQLLEADDEARARAECVRAETILDVISDLD